MSLLDESLAFSRVLGVRPLMERVLSRREILRAQEILITLVRDIHLGQIAAPMP